MNELKLTDYSYLFVLLMLVAVLLSPSPSFAARKKIAIIEFEASGLKQSDAKAITRRFSGKIMSSNKFEMLGKETVNKGYLLFKRNY